MDHGKNDHGGGARRRGGQAMLITVLSLGGAILGATTVAGLLTLYQIRATTDSANSAKAVFAADAATEWALFDYNCNNLDTPSRCPGGSAPAMPALTGSGAQASVNCYSDTAATQPSSCSDADTVAAIATGQANGSERAFYTELSTSTAIYP